MPNVCQLVRWIASPKHPQSLTGRNVAEHNVITVKKSVKTRLITENNLILNPFRIAIPIKNSIQHRIMAPGVAKRSKKLRFIAPKYSLIFKEVPTGSNALRNPETINTTPIRILLIPFRNLIIPLFIPFQTDMTITGIVGRHLLENYINNAVILEKISLAGSILPLQSLQSTLLKSVSRFTSLIYISRTRI